MGFYHKGQAIQPNPKLKENERMKFMQPPPAGFCGECLSGDGYCEEHRVPSSWPPPQPPQPPPRRYKVKIGTDEYPVHGQSDEAAIAAAKGMFLHPRFEVWRDNRFVAGIQRVPDKPIEKYAFALQEKVRKLEIEVALLKNRIDQADAALVFSRQSLREDLHKLTKGSEWETGNILRPMLNVGRILKGKRTI